MFKGRVQLLDHFFSLPCDLTAVALPASGADGTDDVINDAARFPYRCFEVALDRVQADGFEPWQHTGSVLGMKVGSEQSSYEGLVVLADVHNGR